MYKKEHIEKYIEQVKKLNFDKVLSPAEYSYENPALILIDAVLSINRQYRPFVVPRLEYFKKNFPFVNSLNELKTLIEKYGKTNFHKVWNYKHEKRVEILSDLVSFFINIKQKNEKDIDAMKRWARTVDLSKYKLLPVSGIGFATSQYIRKMLEIDTVKPDVHILKSIKLWGEVSLNEREAVEFIEEVSKKLGLSSTTLDNTIWKHFSYG